jgi:hypothetical protein
MKCVAIGLDVVAFILGMAAAWFWLKSSLVIVRDPFPQDGISRATTTGDFVFPTITAFSEAGRLNKIAAALTAASVLFGTLGNLASAWPLWPCHSN